jgi:hypothetical protein
MKHVLIEIKNLIQDPAHWTQGTHARNKIGNPVKPADPDACQWCLDGALGKVTNIEIAGYRNNLEYQRANALLLNATQELFGVSNFVEINDEGSHHEVLAILDHAMGLTNARAA